MVVFRSAVACAALVVGSVATPISTRDSGVIDVLAPDAAAIAEGLAARAAAETIDPSLLPDLNYFVQYAGAAYCDPNNVVGTQVSCNNSVCPDVTANDVTTIAVFHDTGDADTTGIVARDDSTQNIVVAFRGSRSIRNWLANLDIVFEDAFCDGCKIHSGFYNAYLDDADTIRDAVAQLKTEHPNYGIVAAGHSLGGALATVAATDLRALGYEVTIYSFGSPRLGNKELSEFITNNGTVFRVTHLNDPVPQLPPTELGYRHVSPEYWISVGDSNIPASAIKVLTGTNNQNGNAGTKNLLNGTAHVHYLLPDEIAISSCTNSTFEF